MTPSQSDVAMDVATQRISVLWEFLMQLATSSKKDVSSAFGELPV